MQSKMCRHCHENKPHDQFHKHKLTKDKLNSWCKFCAGRQSTEYGRANRASRKKSQAKYYKKNKATIALRIDLWRDKNRDSVNAARRRLWAQNDKGREYQRQHRAKRPPTPRHRLNASMRANIYDSLKGQKHGRKWEALVGFTVCDLTTWIETQFSDGMGWDNRGEWHIDHIIPISAFKFATASDPSFKACWSLANMRPLWKTANQKKGAKCIPGYAEAMTILARAREQPICEKTVHVEYRATAGCAT